MRIDRDEVRVIDGHAVLTGGERVRWNKLRAAIAAERGYLCEDCGSEEILEFHHILPRADGGAYFDPDNIKILCRRCHYKEHLWLKRSKGCSKDRLEWLEHLKSYS